LVAPSSTPFIFEKGVMSKRRFENINTTWNYWPQQEKQ